MAVNGYRPKRAARHETVLLRGLKTHLTRWGPQPDPHHPPLIFLHGFMDTSATFQFLIDALVADWPVVALDWRGFGRSEWPQDGYWFPDYLADLDALLNQLSPATAVQVLGHSMGANVATLYAGTRPQRVRTLVSLEGFGLPRTAAPDAPRRYRQWLDELHDTPSSRLYASFEQLAQALRVRYPRVPPERALFIAQAWGREQDGGVRLTGDPRHRRVNPVLYRREEAESCWRQIKAPMLLVFGERSEVLQDLGADGTPAAFEALIPQLKTVSLAGVGHMMHLERPDLVAPLVEAFLQTP